MSSPDQREHRGSPLPLVGRAGDRPRVVLAVRDHLAPVRRLCRPGVDILELRVDQFSRLDPAHVENVARQVGKEFGRPLLATVRWQREGGGAGLADQARLELFRTLLPHVAAVDVELRAPRSFQPIVREAQDRHRAVVLSYHDFERTPSARELERLYRRACDRGADIVKFAVQAHQAQDVWRLATFTWQHRESAVVTMAMGRLGPLSRLILPLFGSRWVYTSVAPAHGQIPLARLLEDLRFYFP
ncbi:MAG: 3-dehydroquinate dehydratase [Candidatus Binatia bacterium]|nr:MAG: 3-dehydroquinate dehydratase [Candidatus Binatia bacterium]